MGNKKAGFFYGYVVVAAGFFVMVITSGLLYSFGVFLKSLAMEFGWTRAAISGAYSMSLFVVGLLFAVSGRMTDSFGPRLVVTCSAVLLGLGYFLLSRISAIWELYLCYGILIAMGNSGSLVPMTSTIARWFVKKRGLMTGIVVAGVGVGQMIIPPMVTQIISVYGWRIAFVVAGIMSLVMLALIAQFLRRDPDQV